VSTEHAHEHDHGDSKKRLLGFYNAAKWAMDGVCTLDVYAEVDEHDEAQVKKELEDLGINYDLTKKGIVKGYFEGSYDRVLPIMRTLLEKGWHW
jgi:hypothetical protein